jgi:adenosine deaminase
VYPSIAEHSLPDLIKEGLYITINSDDPPMFNTTLTNEFIQLHKQFGWDVNFIKDLTFNALQASLLPVDQKQTLREKMQTEFNNLHTQLAI